MNIIETDRLVLRRLTPEDADDLAALYADPEVMRFFGGPRTPEQTQAQIAWCLAEYERGNPSLWATVLKADSRFIGRCGLLPQMLDGQPEAEVAYMIARPLWNRGLGTEAAHAIQEYAFRNYKFGHVISIIAPDNVASQRVAEKNGMRYERDAEYGGHLCRIYSVDRLPSVDR
jgi:ribosomal-protein-alanine N-acetyltransferase